MYNCVFYCRINLRANEIPKCTPICTDALPIAPPHTDLELKEVIPKSNPKERRNLTSYGNEHKPAYSGDRLVYQCKTDKWVTTNVKPLAKIVRFVHFTKWSVAKFGFF